MEGSGSLCVCFKAARLLQFSQVKANVKLGIDIHITLLASIMGGCYDLHTEICCGNLFSTRSRL